MSVAQSPGADDYGPSRKKLKVDAGDDFQYGTRITILRACGTSICHVPTGEFEKICTNTSASICNAKWIFGTSIEVHDFGAGRSIIKFLAHWIHHRDPHAAIDATMNRRTEREAGFLDGDWLKSLITVLNYFDPTRSTSDIADSLVDNFLCFWDRGGGDHMDEVFDFCKICDRHHALTKVFANVFLHRKKEFLKQVPTCDYDRPVQQQMHEWLADVFVNDRDWNKLPPKVQRSTQFDNCYCHTHGKDKDCYVLGKIINPGCS